MWGKESEEGQRERWIAHREGEGRGGEKSFTRTGQSRRWKRRGERLTRTREGREVDRNRRTGGHIWEIERREERK